MRREEDTMAQGTRRSLLRARRVVETFLSWDRLSIEI